MKKLLAMVLCLLLLTTALAGCGAKTEESMEMTTASYAAGAMPVEAPMEEMIEEEWGAAEVAMEEAAPETVEATAQAVDPEGETTDIGDKIIYSAGLYMETTEFDKALASLNAMIEEVGGYIQHSSVDGSTRYHDDGTTSVVDRYAFYSVAVPSEKFESVLTRSGEIGNVTSQQRFAENITSQYTDTEARVNSLRVQEERLLAMMEEATDIESLIALEARLSEVTYEIESYERTLRNWDHRVAYSTVDISLQEVEIYTPTAPVTRTFSERIADAFSDGWYSFGRGIQNFAVFLVEGIPTLLLLAAIAVGVGFAVRGIRRKRAKKKAEKQRSEEKTQQ